LWGFQTSRRVVERLGSDGAAGGVVGSLTGAAAQTGRLTGERAEFYKKKSFGIHPALLIAVIMIFGGLWLIGTLMS
jgi:hypothetical protein